jgi:hypothetical protein
MTETQNAIGDWEIWQNIMEWEWEKRATDKPAFKEKYEQHSSGNGKSAQLISQRSRKSMNSMPRQARTLWRAKGRNF